MAPLEEFLLGWRREVAFETQPRAALRALWRIRRSKFLLVIGWVWVGRCLVETAMATNSDVLNIGLVQFAALHLAIFGVYVFAFRGSECANALGCLILVTRCLERKADPATQVVFRKMIRRQRWVSAFSLAAWVAHILASFQTVHSSQHISPLNAVLVPIGGIWYKAVNGVFVVFQLWLSVLGPLAYYRMLAMASALFGVASVLYRGMAIQCVTARGGSMQAQSKDSI
ncbi:uncharacterized protein LOC117646565 [Thrips palmi]|uniref:Uncharacterized protein LOC117646565 n=1 Tax=Thrips palmi TaxID=161013 RepID=A0A6P8Z925_THRPL|nr:uncharacterized protein LOC117646565 [Thrips palmi]